MQVVPSLQKNVHSNSLLCSRWLRTLLLKSRGSRLPWSVSQFAGVIVLPSGYPHPHLFKLFWRNKNMGEAASSEIIDETSVHESYHIYPAPVSVATVYLPLTAGKQSQTKQQRLKSITSAQPSFNVATVDPDQRIAHEAVHERHLILPHPPSPAYPNPFPTTFSFSPPAR